MIEAPADDEIEISVFGPGYGEAILVHAGNRRWVAIDSCIDPTDPSIVIPLKYLQDIGVNCAADVACVVATHWHDDHIRGLSGLLSTCVSARFCCAAAFTKKEFIRFALANAETDPSALGKATDEVASIIRYLADNDRKPHYVGPDRLLYRCDNGIQLFSLSPSDERIDQFLNRLCAELPTENSTRVRAADLKPNDIAVAILLQAPGGSVLLGADLEEEPGRGWTMIIEESQCLQEKASAFKIPHHGSGTGYCEDVWKDLLTPDPIAVVAPWRRGGNSLPNYEDVNRILNKTQNAYITARPDALSPQRRDNTVERNLRTRGIKLSLTHQRPGHVQLRRKLRDRQWRVRTEGTAVQLKHALEWIKA